MESGKSILELCVSDKENNDDFADIIDKSLNQASKAIRKRIVSCAIELIQNNLIYNNKGEIIIEVFESEESYFLNTARKIDYEGAKILKNKISAINSTEREQLKKIFLENLDKNTSGSTGNGLILCRLKSDDEIIVTETIDRLEINLRFNK